MQNVLSSGLLSQNLKIKKYRIIILPFVLCGFESWLLTLREERRLRVFDNRVLRRIFGPKRWRIPCALGSTQPLKISTRIFLGVKTAGA